MSHKAVSGEKLDGVSWNENEILSFCHICFVLVCFVVGNYMLNNFMFDGGIMQFHLCLFSALSLLGVCLSSAVYCLTNFSAKVVYGGDVCKKLCQGSSEK